MRVRNHQPGRERPCTSVPHVPRPGTVLKGRGRGRVRYRGTDGQGTDKGRTPGAEVGTWAMYSVVYVQRGRARSGVNTARPSTGNKAGQGKAQGEWRGHRQEWARSRSYLLLA
jgi:hypothetical protein